jgi:hypothetical protein
MVSLTLGRKAPVESSRFAIRTRVIEVWFRSIVNAPRIETFNVLPCVARLAVYRVSIVVVVVADTLDCVRLLVYRLSDDEMRIVC